MPATDETTGYTEDCCWTDIRQFCKGKTCACRCHISNPEPSTSCANCLRILAREVESLRLARQSEERAIAAEDALSAAQAEVQRLTDERDELIRHKDTNECTSYGHRWRDAFGSEGALCQCRAMVFAVWADEVRPSTETERANPSAVRVIDNPDRSARAHELDDEYDSIVPILAAQPAAVDDPEYQRFEAAMNRVLHKPPAAQQQPGDAAP